MIKSLSTFILLMLVLLPTSAMAKDWKPLGFQPTSINVTKSSYLKAINKDHTPALNDLHSEKSTMTVGQWQANGKISFGPFGASVEKGNYVVVVDYMKYRPTTVSVDNQDVDIFIGVSIRMKATLQVTKGGVNLGSLGGIAAAANAEKLNGSISFESIGITGSKITPLIPIPSEINQESIVNAIQTMSSIKAMLYDSAGDVTITPVVIGYNANGSLLGTQIEELVK